jgi:hypothetical protein
MLGGLVPAPVRLAPKLERISMDRLVAWRLGLPSCEAAGAAAGQITRRPGAWPTMSENMPPRWATLTTRFCEARPSVASP